VENELGLLTSDDINKKMDLIVNKTNFLSETINTFRNFLKSDKSYKNLILENEIQDALNVVSSTLQNNNIDLQNMIPNGQSTEIEMVSGELPQVMVNIVNNAKDVLLEKNVLNPWIKLDLSKNENGKHIITIEDNGGGIPDSVMPKIFDPYFTTKHQSQGTGLGLHMSYKIITDSLHGKLYVKNTDNGAKFYIEL
jgi:C4-dicarboxylate-specific signal transduction histidine kinase